MDPRLTQYKQHTSDNGSTVPSEEVRYSGLSPSLVQQKRRQRVLQQSGRALVWHTAPMKPPAPIVENPIHLEQPEIKYVRVSGSPPQWETTWSYLIAIDDNAVIDHVASQAWPQTIEVEPTPGVP